MSEWDGYILEDYAFRFAPHSVVADIGCGEGMLVSRLTAEGHTVIGLDIDPFRFRWPSGSRVLQARAEALPLRDGSLDGVLLKVVMPYLDDKQAISEIARVLKPGGQCYIVGHGFGYSLRYALRPSDWRVAVYGVRTIVNSAVYFLTGKRLPGFWGDTIGQTSKRLIRCYRENGLVLTSETLSSKFAGSPVFIHHDIRKAQIT